MLSENEAWVVTANISNRIRRLQKNTTAEGIDKEAYNRQLDDWFYRHGITIIPQNTIQNRPSIKWSEFQNRRPFDDEYEVWKKNGLFNKGVGGYAW